MSSNEFDDDFEGAEDKVYITKTYVRPTGHIYKETTLDGLLHAGPLGEPSAATYTPEGHPIRFAWHAYGEEHRTDGPAKIMFFVGTKQPGTEVFKIDGRARPRELGPSVIRWNEDGGLRSEEFASETELDQTSQYRKLEP